LVVCEEGDGLVGHAQYVGIDDDGGMVAASDPRSDGAGVVVTR
jgi:hypothetical protein